jgi:hypothetical protein
VGDHHQLGAVPGGELGQQVADVGLHRRVADEQPFGDLDVGQPVRHRDLNAFGGGFFFAMVTGADQARLGLLLGIAYALLGVLAYVAWRLAGSRRADARRGSGSDPSLPIPARDQSAASV